MAESYRLEKPIFEAMSWHDALVWSVVAIPGAFEFAIDLDYIFKWVKPEEGEVYFRFWVSPVTMVFENVHSVRLAIESEQGQIEVADLHREESRLTPNKQLTEALYRFECQEGELSLWATGFKMYVRKEPVLMDLQSFTLSERSGISFGRGIDGRP